MHAAELHHRSALALRARPALEPAALRVVEALQPLAEWLWLPAEANPDAPERRDEGAPDVALFLDALDHLIPAGLAAEDPGRLVQVLQWVGRGNFRALPTRLLASMARHLAFRGIGCGPNGSEAATTKLAHLEVAHVARWWVTTGQPAKRNPDDFAKMVSCAQAWHLDEELALRTNIDVHWKLPLLCDNLSISGFTMTPISTVSQLVDARQHKGVLCGLARRDACIAGREAWIYASPKRLSTDAEICLIGFERATPESAWASPVVYGPTGSHEWLERGAAALVARDRAARLRGYARHGVTVSRETAAGLRTILESMTGRR